MFEIPLEFRGGRIEAHLRVTSMGMGAPTVQYPVTFRPGHDVEFLVASRLRQSRIRIP
jgi:hypothetical protein